MQDYRKERPELVIVYFYFDFKDPRKQLHGNFLRSAIAQFANQHREANRALHDLYSKSQDGKQQPSAHSLEDVLFHIVSFLGSVCIIIDALDECTERNNFFPWLIGLLSKMPNGFRLLITSRRERDIEECLEGQVPCQIDLESTLVDHDIGLLVAERLRTDSRLKKWPVEIQAEITVKLMERAHGM